MINMFNRLFVPLALREETEDTGLVSPYSVPKTAVTALAIDELENDNRKIGYIITNTHRRCAPGINLVKKIDLEGFLTFKSRIKEALELNAILDGNDVLQDQISDLFTWAYAEVSKKDTFLIYSDTTTAKKVANAIYLKTQTAGLKLPAGKIAQLFQNVLLTVLTKLDHSKAKA